MTDTASVLLDDSEPQVKIADLSSIKIDYANTNSAYADDESLPLGVVDITFDSPLPIKDYMGQFVNVVRNTTSPRRALVRSITPKLQSWSVSADMGDTNRNYEYQFVPVEVAGGIGKEIYFTTTSGQEFPPVFNFDGVVPTGTHPGYVGNGLSAIASLAQAYGGFVVNDELWQNLEIVEVPFGEANVTRPMSIKAWNPNLARSEPARNVEIIWYEGGYGSDLEVVPSDANIISVDAGETVVVDINTNAWLESVNQPTCVDLVLPDEHYYDGTNGVYAVAGNDNRSIEPAEWNATGGKLTVEISPDDPKMLRVTVTGMASPLYSPFRIAMTSDVFYPALRVTADATRAEPHTLRIPTGVDEKITKTDVGITVDNPFITDLDRAYAVGTRLARKYTGLVLSLSGDAIGIEPLQLLDDDFMRFMVRSSHGDETDYVSFTAEEFTRMGDFEEAWAGFTMGDFENVWAGKTMGQFMIAELRNPLKYGTGYFIDLYNGLWGTTLDINNGDGTWTSNIPVDNGNGTWTA